jgi:hypothetical protein
MANHTVAIYKRNQGGDRSRQPAYPKVNYGPGTTFLLRYTAQGKRVWKTLPVQTYMEALVAAKQQELELWQRDAANLDHSTPITRTQPKPAFVEPVTPAVLPVQKPVVRDTLGMAIDTYMANIRITGRACTAQSYEVLFRQFYDSATKGGMVARQLKDITKQDLVNFAAYLQKRGCAEVTIHHKSTIVQCLLRTNDNHAALKTKYTPKDVVSYHPEEIKQLFAHATESEWLLFNFFLCSGGREGEVANAEWSQIDFIARIFTIRQTDSFNTKNSKVRRIPLPDYLVTKLKAHMLSSKGRSLFPRADGKPDERMHRVYPSGRACHAPAVCIGGGKLTRRSCLVLVWM